MAAICVWEGSADYYRDLSRHGGILSTFLGTWFNRTLVERQHGYGERGARSWVTGELAAGPETLSDDVLADNRIDPGPEVLTRPLDGAYYRDRSPQLGDRAAAFGGELGRRRLASAPAISRAIWLRRPSRNGCKCTGMHILRRSTVRTGRNCRSAFSVIFSKVRITAGTSSRRCSFMAGRHPGEKFVVRDEREWPLARTQWTKLYLDPAGRSVAREPKAGAAWNTKRG